MNTQSTMEFRNLGDKPLSYLELYRLFNIVNERYNENLPTITYCNRTPSELTHILVDYSFTMFDERATAYHISKCEELVSAIVSRLWEMGVTHERTVGISERL